MEKEEQYIYDRCGKQNPFTVPDGYFDSLRTELMQHATTTTKAIPLWNCVGEVMWLRHVWWVWLLLGLLPIGA